MTAADILLSVTATALVLMVIITAHRDRPRR
jgi:hypothetical protein